MRPLSLLGLALALAACRPEADVKDPDLDTDVVPDPDTGSFPEDGITTAVVATVSDDYSVGALATISVPGWRVTDEIVDAPSDSTVVSTGGRIIQLNRYGFDTVRIYEPGEWSAPTVEFALPDLANPHDVEVCDGAAFITQYDRGSIAVHDPDSGLLIGSIDLSDFDDGDGTPEASRIVKAGNGKLYIGTHNLDRDGGWVAVGGHVLEVDCASRSVTNSWGFTDADVYAYPGDPSQVVVHEDGIGVHLLDPATLESVLIVSSETIGATVDGLVAYGDKAVTIASTDDGEYSVGCIDFTARTYTEVLASDNYLAGISGTGTGESWISARTHWSGTDAPAGVQVFDVATCTERTTDGPIATVLAPSSIAFY